MKGTRSQRNRISAHPTIAHEARPGARLRLVVWIALLLILASLSLLSADTASADPLTPVREKLVTIQEEAFSWWMLDWATNEVLCKLTIYHDGLPTRLEILDQCGGENYQQWLETPSCSSEEVASCQGSYLHYVGSQTETRTISIELPTASASLELEECAASSSLYSCHGQPKLVIQAEEPLPNENIISVNGTLAGMSFTCKGNRCQAPLRPTPPGGYRLAFWAHSSYGDTSPAYTAKVRVVVAGQDDWQVSVLSDRLRSPRPPSCALSWQSLPPAEQLPEWLTNPSEPEQLVTHRPYHQLAERLVRGGLVSTDHCPSLGFGADGSLNACGLEASWAEVLEWQNQFDLRIYALAQQRNVPARLLKNIFAKESQFWPGLDFDDVDEAGFGHLTEMGADTTLLWNPGFFAEFCPLILDHSSCAQGYAGLLPGEQKLLRGALFQNAHASCSTCPQGIDLKRADASIQVFAETLLANCGQVGQMLRNLTQAQPGDAASYVDLWKFTIASYHGGPGCMANALTDTWQNDQPLIWEAVAGNLEPGCDSIIGYVDEVTTSYD